MPDQLLDEVDRSDVRYEDVPFDWEKLTRDQKLAVLDCHRRFTMIANQPFAVRSDREPAGIDRFLPDLHTDMKKVNRVVLIDGGRGSGKSVAMVCLFRHWSRQVRKELEQTKQQEFLSMIRSVEQLDHGDQQKLAPIVPIGFTSVSVIERSASLFTFIAAYLHLVIDAIGAARGADRSRPTSPWTSVADSGSPLSLKWNQFLQAIAHASDDQGQERQKTLDPEAWALELRDSEFRRRDVASYFYMLMDELVKEYARAFGEGQYPLFVVGVDDADLVPGQLVPLLNAIRLLDHPRIAFLLTGDTDLFIQALTDTYLGRLRKPLREVDLYKDLDFDRRKASRLAQDIFDKVVPKGQRYRLPKLRHEERLALIDGEQFGKVAFAADALPRLVSEPRKTHATTEHRQLQSYFTDNPPIRPALPPRLRDIMAFNEYLKSRTRSAAEVVERLWRDALERSTIPPVQEILKPAVRRDYEGDRESLLVQTYGLRCEFLPRQIIPQRRLRDRWFVALREIANYEIKHESLDQVLAEDAKAALILATDFVADSVLASFLGRSISPNEFGVPFVTVSYAATDLHTYDFVWPLPDWDAFIDFDTFSRRWRDTLHTSGIASEILESKDEPARPAPQANAIMGRIARLFLRLAIDVCDHRSESSTSTADCSWKQLATQLKALAQAETRRGPSRRNRHIVDWARTHAGLLAAPESGLSSRDANDWLNAIQVAGVLDQDAAVLARERRAQRAVGRRAEHATKPLHQEPEEEVVRSLIAEIDKRSRGYKWLTLKRASTGSATASSHAQ